MRKAEVLICLTMKITAKVIDVNDIFIDVSVTAATIISAFTIELHRSCCTFLLLFG